MRRLGTGHAVGTLSLQQERLLLSLPLCKVALQRNPGLRLLKLLQIVLADVGLQTKENTAC
jgi:hypothetical protein